MVSGLIDTDEFIVLRNESSLPHLLEDYERYGGLVLYFRIFGSSGLIGRPSSGILASYTKCQPKDDNSYVKTIARTDACKKITGVHRCSYYQGKVAGKLLYCMLFRMSHDTLCDTSRSYV